MLKHLKLKSAKEIDFVNFVCYWGFVYVFCRKPKFLCETNGLRIISLADNSSWISLEYV